MQREKPPEWREKQKGSRGIRRGQRYRLVFQFPIRQELSSCVPLGGRENALPQGAASGKFYKVGNGISITDDEKAGKSSETEWSGKGAERD